MDVGGTRFINVEDFLKILKGGGVELPSEKDMNKVVASFSYGVNHNVDYNSFLEYSNDIVPDIEEEIVADKLRNLLAKLGKDNETRDKKLFDLFDQMDVDHNEVVDEKVNSSYQNYSSSINLSSSIVIIKVVEVV